MTEHEEAADRAEREVEDMARHGEQLDEDIADAREQWEAKQRDSSIPGAVGEPREEMPPPEPDETD